MVSAAGRGGIRTVFLPGITDLPRTPLKNDKQPCTLHCGLCIAMAAATPTLNGVPYGDASRIPYYVEGRQLHSVHPGTPEAESLFESYTAQIAQSANMMTPVAHLVVSDNRTWGSSIEDSLPAFRVHGPRVSRVRAPFRCVDCVPFCLCKRRSTVAQDGHRRLFEFFESSRWPKTGCGTRRICCGTIVQ